MSMELLIAPFPREQIKQREGPGGVLLDYVEFGDVGRRLIEATKGVGFSWEVLSISLYVDAKSVTHHRAHGRLTIPGLGSRDGIGTHPNYDGESPKVAETDAFKRAAVKFGVALDLYDKDKAYRNQQIEQPVGQPQQAQNGQSSPSREGIWQGPGQCQVCYAPAGKRHGRQCLQQ